MYIYSDIYMFSVNQIKNTFEFLFSDVIRSMIGTLLWIGVITAWVTIYQLNRADWGEIGDNLSFIIPKGIA